MKQKLFAGVSLLLAIAFLYTGQRFVLKDAFSMLAMPAEKTTAAATTVPTADETTESPSTAPTTTTPASTAATQTDPSTAATTATQPVTSTSAAPSSAATTAAPTQTQKPTTAPGTQTQPTEPSTPAHSTQPTQPTDPTDPSTRTPPVSPPADRVFRQAPPDYFKDALFIGDSRTEELMEYGDLPGATFFARVSMSIYNMHKKTCKVNNGIGDISFDDLMANYKFKKV